MANLRVQPVPPIPSEYLNIRPGHMYPDLLPQDVSLDFEMTKDNLFAVWFSPSKHQKLIRPQQQDIQLDWCLADEDNPLEQIQRLYGAMPVWACMSLSDLESTLMRLKNAPFWKSFFSSKIFYIADQGLKQWSYEKKGQVLFEGEIEDIEKVVQEGMHIFNTKQYRGVGDARGVQEGRPKDWIRFMTNVDHALALREKRKEHLGHDGSK